MFFNTLWAASEPERMFTCSYLNEMPKKNLDSTMFVLRDTKGIMVL